MNVAAVVAAQSAKEAMEKAEAAEKKAADDKKNMEAEYAKLKADTQKAYNDLREKDLENFAKISEINYGVYHVTQEKKKIDINTTIAHLRLVQQQQLPHSLLVLLLLVQIFLFSFQN